MKLGVKFLYLTSSSGENFYIYQLREGLGMRNMLAHGIRMQKNTQTRDAIFWIFMEFSNSKVQLALPHKNFINGVANPKIVYQWE